MRGFILTSITLSTIFSLSAAQAQEPLIQQEPSLSRHENEHEPGADNPLDLTQSAFMGLMTYANLPYIHCLATEDVNDDYKGEKYDIAVYVWRLCLTLIVDMPADFALGLALLLTL